MKKKFYLYTLKSSVSRLFISKSAPIVACFLLFFISQAVHAVEYSGQIKYLQTQDITSPVTGIVKSTPIVGKFYKKGSVLLSFDSYIIDKELSFLKQKINLLAMQLSEEVREFERAEELYDAGNLSDYDLKHAKIKLDQAKLNLQETKDKLASKRWTKKFYTLKAPFDGVIVSNDLYSGKYVSNTYEAKPLMQFVSTNDMNVHVRINKSEFTQLSLDNISLDKKDRSRATIYFGKYNYSAKLISKDQQEEKTLLNLTLDLSEFKGEIQMLAEGSDVRVAIGSDK